MSKANNEIRVAKDKNATTLPLSKEEAIVLVHEIVKTFESDNHRQKDLRLYSELESLAGLIQRAKNELSAIGTDEISNEQLPSVHDELGEIIGATERATGEILEAVEKIQEVSSKVDHEVEAVIIEQVTQIFEACNFQDLTGQRIKKVVSTLKNIDSKVHALLLAFGDERADAEKAKLYKDNTETKRQEDLLLHGPQAQGVAIDQNMVDELFG